MHYMVVNVKFLIRKLHRAMDIANVFNMRKMINLKVFILSLIMCVFVNVIVDIRFESMHMKYKYVYMYISLLLKDE